MPPDQSFLELDPSQSIGTLGLVRPLDSSRDMSRKKRKLNTETSRHIGDVVAEIDLEVCLRQRLAGVLDARITWALAMQQALRKGGKGSTASFGNTAFDALYAIEAPLAAIFNHEALPIPRMTSAQTNKNLHSLPRQKSTGNSSATFLYISSAYLHPTNDAVPIRTYLLRCPRCLRTSFTSIQGLLNHARISHGLEWGTHDECVRACAVSDPDIDITAGIEVVLGPNGILPGLRSLFEMAVGAHHTKAQYDNAKTAGEQVMDRFHVGSRLVRTLGLHENTPALALFLGKVTGRRGIKVWDEDEIVDIGSSGSADFRSRPQDIFINQREDSHLGQRHGAKWRMQFPHRSDFDSSHVSPDPAECLQGSSSFVDANSGITDNHPAVIAKESERLRPRNVATLSTTPGSRFHFLARIVIVDRSLWVPTDRRQISSKNYTHKWMVSVDSPSYSRHITTILKSITVTSLSDPSGSFPTLTTTNPPFVVVGVADEPFLAKVELCFSDVFSSVGEIINQIVVLEHWVELDLMKSSAPVIGDEQVIDIELDKGTILLPIQQGYTRIGAKVLWAEAAESLDRRPELRDDSVHEYDRILNSLLDRFPMTMKDIKNNRAPPHLPYKLVATIHQLKSLVPGRRKAIEWGRARALQGAYTKAIQEQQSSSHSLISLTTADVFTWLKEQGHFVRPLVGPSEANLDGTNNNVRGQTVETWCSFCGQRTEAHITMSGVKKEVDHPMPLGPLELDEGYSSVKSEGTPSRSSLFLLPCSTAHRPTQMPMVDVSTRLLHSALESDAETSSEYRELVAKTSKISRNAEYVKASHPQLLLAIRDIILSSPLPAFLSLTPNKIPQLESSFYNMGIHKTSIEAHLAPHAILAIATKHFLRVLIEGGLDVWRKERVDSRPTKRMRKIARGGDSFTSILTPAHIFGGIISRASNRKHGVNFAVFELLARLGILIDVTSTNDPRIRKPLDLDGSRQSP